MTRKFFIKVRRQPTWLPTSLVPIFPNRHGIKGVDILLLLSSKRKNPTNILDLLKYVHRTTLIVDRVSRNKQDTTCRPIGRGSRCRVKQRSRSRGYPQTRYDLSVDLTTGNSLPSGIHSPPISGLVFFMSTYTRSIHPVLLFSLK